MNVGDFKWLLHWSSIRRVGQVLRPAWFATAVIIFIIIVFDMAQTRDVISDVREGTNDWTSKQLALGVGALTLGLWAWYFPRALLSISYWNTPVPVTPQEAARFRSVRKWYPRILGLMPYITLSISFLQDGRKVVAMAYLVGGAVFLLFVIMRRKRWLNNAPIHSEKASIETSTFLILSIILSTAFALLVVFTVSRVAFPQVLGAAAIVLYAAAAWVAFGSLILIHVTYRYALPSLTLVLLVLAYGFGYFNDNHHLRKGTGQPSVANPQAVKDHFVSWIKQRPNVFREESPTYPIYVIAAEGGGIRAAYWTASVLAKLEDENPGFACHVYAISGVSGGSLGAAVFTAAIAERVRNGKPVCAGTTDSRDPKMMDIVRTVLGHDFLAPTVAGLLFPDLLQKFLPLHFQVTVLPDRAVFFEESLEHGWSTGWQTVTQKPSSIFQENFDNLWQKDPQHLIPSLFMNATWVDTGSRAIVSNLDIEEDLFMHAEGVLPLLTHPVPLSTAVHLSARFPFISPPATLELKDEHPHDGPHTEGALKEAKNKKEPRKQPRYGYLVDGGYVDNLGGRTAAEILAILKQQTDDFCKDSVNTDQPEKCLTPNVAFIPILITNDHKNLNVFKPQLSEEERQKDLCPAQPRPNAFVHEVWAPVDTLFQSRSARGYMEERTIQYSAQTHGFYRFALAEYLPQDVLLGWMLAHDTRTAIDSALDANTNRFAGLPPGTLQRSTPSVTACHQLK